MTFLDEEARACTKQDLYFARICAEIRRSWVDKPSSVKDVDFIIDLLDEALKKSKTAQDVKNSMAIWKAFLMASYQGSKGKKKELPDAVKKATREAKSKRK